MWTGGFEHWTSLNLMSWWTMKALRVRSKCSMSFLCVVWMLMVFLAPGSQGQRLSDTEGEKSVSPHISDKDAVCHEEGCYAVFLQKRTFREAGRSCRERGGTLATMYNSEAAGVVHDLLWAIEAQGGRQRLRIWIGLHRMPRQCSSSRPLRGFVWVTGDQDGQFTNWLREDFPGSCAAPRCVAMTVHTSLSTQEGNNFKWIDGSCGLALDGYVCQYNFKGICPPLKDEGGGPPIYTTPFHLVSTQLTHVPYGSVAVVRCPGYGSELENSAEQTVICMERDDQTVGWSRDGPLCSANADTQSQDWCSGNHRCEQFCQSTDTDYYCYCAEGFTLGEDGYMCKPDPLSQTERPELSSDSAGPPNQPEVKNVCVEMGCEYDCVETTRGIRCTCPPGYQMSRDGRKCSDVDECQQQPCPQVCVNIPGTFHCTCHPGYQPDNEGECVDIDECLDEGSCEGICENTVGSFRCLCNHGYEPGSGGECVDVDECVGESPCQQQCLNYRGGYQCYCDNGYDLQTDGLTCQPSHDDEEYSTLTPDPSDHIPDLDPDHDKPWSGSFTPQPNYEHDTNFNTDWITEAPEAYGPGKGDGSDNHLNQWDVQLPRRYQTAPSPTKNESTGNEIDHEADPETRETDAANGSAAGTGDGSSGGAEDDGTAAEAGAGKRKHDKSWLLVALLVPLCVFLVVMLALGIVYCTSCAVDKTLSFADCYRWILPTTPPDRRNSKTGA